MPSNDGPQIFGLHPNADLTFRLKESIEMINVLVDTQPKEGGGGGGLSREDQVKEKIEKELLPKLPQDFIILDVLERLKVLRGPKGLVDAVTGKYDTVPLNVFLRQEIEWFQLILNIVRKTLIDMIDAIDGSISMTAEIVGSIDSVFDFRVPKSW
jgi:dynein heavy chain